METEGHSLIAFLEQFVLDSLQICHVKIESEGCSDESIIEDMEKEKMEVDRGQSQFCGDEKENSSFRFDESAKKVAEEASTKEDEVDEDQNDGNDNEEIEEKDDEFETGITKDDEKMEKIVKFSDDSDLEDERIRKTKIKKKDATIVDEKDSQDNVMDSKIPFDVNEDQGNENVVDFKPALGVKHKPKEGIVVNMDDVKLTNCYNYFNNNEDFAQEEIAEKLDSFFKYDKCKDSLEDEIYVDGGLDNHKMDGIALNYKDLGSHDGYVTKDKLSSDEFASLVMEQDMKSQVFMSSTKAEFMLEPVLVNMFVKDMLSTHIILENLSIEYRQISTGYKERGKFVTDLGLVEPAVSVKPREGIGVCKDSAIVHALDSVEFCRDCYQIVEDLSSCLERRKDGLHNQFSPDVVDSFKFDEIGVAPTHCISLFDPGGKQVCISVQGEAVVARDSVCREQLRTGPQFSGGSSEGLVANDVQLFPVEIIQD